MKNLAVLFSVACGVAIVFLIGVVIGYFRLQPAPLLGFAVEAARDLKVNADPYFFDVPKQHLQPRRYAQDGVVIADANAVQPGVTFVSGLFGKKLGMRLYGEDGSLVYEWPINFFKVGEDVMKYPFHALLHGDHLYPNGDFLANLDGRGLLRVSPCGEILWYASDQNHHSIALDDNGHIWTPINGEPYNEPRVYSSPFHFDRIGKFDPTTGEKLAEIDLVDAMIRSDLVGISLAGQETRSDMMHLNDVEVLTSKYADAYPMFEVGDLLLSSRRFNQIWVVDGQDHTVKWWRTGPMISQHDPDFRADGKISLLDNRPGGLAKPGNKHLGEKNGSRIIALDPASLSHETLYQSDDRNSFYTAYRGKHQILDNGNILVIETDGGRVFEVTPAGDVVWSFVNGYDAEHVGWVMSATRYPASYASVADVSCS